MTRAVPLLFALFACKSLLVQGFVHKSPLGFVPNVDATKTSTSSLFYEPDKGSSAEKVVFQNPVLKQASLDILKYHEKYGHPNIPLGSTAGRQCQTLRRLHIQGKLTENEVEWLNELGFTWHSLEEVYKYADFDSLFDRLMDYEANHPESNFQVPKKCKEDPELGAWVTGIRRLGKEGVNPDHERRLDAVGFVWKSKRKCGSKFMEKYRSLVKRAENEGINVVMSDETTIPWILAQQEALKRGTFSQTRVHYMGQLFGENWTTIGRSD